MAVITIRPAISNDVEALTELMHGSAAYRGSYASILNGCAVTSAQVEKDIFHVAERDGELCGFYSLTLEGQPELDLMFVADSTQGIGPERRANFVNRGFIFPLNCDSTCLEVDHGHMSVRGFAFSRC